MTLQTVNLMRRCRVNDTDVTKRVGVELRKATRQLVNDVIPGSMLVCLAELQAAERSYLAERDALSAQHDASSAR